MKTESQRRILLLIGGALCSIGLCSGAIFSWTQLRQDLAQLRTARAFTQLELHTALHRIAHERQQRTSHFLAARQRPMGHEVIQVIQQIPPTFRVETITGTEQEWQLTGRPIGAEEHAALASAEPQPPQTMIVPRVEHTHQHTTEQTS